MYFRRATWPYLDYYNFVIVSDLCFVCENCDLSRRDRDNYFPPVVCIEREIKREERVRLDLLLACLYAEYSCFQNDSSLCRK